ncbi:MAG: hypothetical protein M3451_13660 [Chloroflexota bacterium]|nr:hypothetical protein [Chloroflexota bacterium]
MPINIQTLRDSSRTARINFGRDGDLNVTYFPGRINQDLVERFQVAAEDKDYELQADIFGEIVSEWDLLQEEDGEPVPIDGEAIRNVGALVFNEIWDRLTDSVTPKSRKPSKRS